MHTKTDYRYFLTIPTRWEDCDQYQHVNNVKYYSYFDTIVNHFLYDGHWLAKAISQSSVKGLVVETKCEYFSPINFPDVLSVGLLIDHIGNSSVKYQIGIFKDDILCASGYFIHVYVDQNNRPTPLSNEFRSYLQQFTTKNKEGESTT